MFWKEVNELPEKYASQNITVNKETIYLNHMISYVNQGIFKGLNNDMLYQFGSQLEFYDGIPEIMKVLENIISEDENFSKFEIHVEHYIISTGIKKIIEGSKVADYVKDIWGCEFIEEPINAGNELYNSYHSKKSIQQIGYIIDNTTKTRAIFEINKGSNCFDSIDVNSKIEPQDRRVPFENMIYIADGPSDVPVFSILQQYGGKTLAVHPKDCSAAFNQVEQLLKDRRIDMYAEADYSQGSAAYRWIEKQIKSIVKEIYTKKNEAIRKSVSLPPTHIT